MYNYFIESKRKKDEEIRQELEKKTLKIRQKRISNEILNLDYEYPLLVNNYEKRIKNFVYEVYHE